MGCQKFFTKRGKKERHRRSLSDPSVLQKLEKKWCQLWMNEQMTAAIKSVQEGKFGVYKATMQHCVPQSTHKDHLSGHVQHGTKPGPFRASIRLKKRTVIIYYQLCPSWICEDM